MSEIAELERRITAALERIGRGLDSLPAGTGAGAEGSADRQITEEASEQLRARDAEIVDLRGQLAAERAAGAQLSERIKAVKEKQETGIAALERKVADMTRQLDVQGLELQRMKKTNVHLRETIRILREAMQEGLAEPHLINKSMLAELEALRASRAAEMAEMDEILSGLEPLLGRTAPREAATGENGNA
ncbi:hypothetical protein U879_20265 [Defluviimonas sp. 20V17]|uniref:Uncharacterized protein n=1 Tax=Allgaiera indica TaxID=765699 RepID=A0AAN4ZZP5_9RHOB|nr:hypothetical protein [Allgaiera indica]KDB01884.1 hypothetical protein U879_20265 [Defluviimonas sp. 20V17]GHE02404.1 hypothetical protein GCM10008024_21730 [Allgaiera indica]SDX30354.1 hypothetical protein SAMN05444006_11383 [Allgaiera indica]